MATAGGAADFAVAGSEVELVVDSMAAAADSMAVAAVAGSTAAVVVAVADIANRQAVFETACLN